ncbi:MAG TPA: CheR family methyltransferase [Paraburkholderia sp.]|nr:CheR family methyltransferase [Paraburkholderia sp.]
MNAPSIDARFEDWLLRETGISASTLGVHAFERAVRERARITQAGGTPLLAPGDTVAEDARQGAADGGPALPEGVLEAYWHLLAGSLAERQALIELIVVPETWFFRDREAFAALARLANERLVREPAQMLRLLSAPCSTGEEPYTIAMALLDAGIGPERFSVDAVDISARALDVARAALYGRNSFRGRALEFRDRHFDAVDGGYRLNERVRQAVRFTQANLFDAAQMPETRFDFIFCRNVLIYFDRAAQDRAIRLLDARLAQHGTLFVGPAETGLMMRHAFSSARIPLAFAFQRTPRDDAAQAAAARAGAGGAGGATREAAPWAGVKHDAGWPQAPRANVLRPAGTAAGSAGLATSSTSATSAASSTSATSPTSATRATSGTLATSATSSTSATFAASAAWRQPAPQAKPAGQSPQPPSTQPAAPIAPKPASVPRPRSAAPWPGASPAHPERSDAPVAAAPTDARAQRVAELERAERLADAGRLDDAFRAASDCVIVHGPDAAAFYLLGLIMDAQGRGADAGDYYRKALYLQPDHYEALTHLAALLEMNGDSAGAERFARRAQRAALKPAERTRGFHD